MNGILTGGITDEMIRISSAADADSVGDMSGHMGNPFRIGDEKLLKIRLDRTSSAVENEQEKTAGNDDEDVDVYDDEVVGVDMKPCPPGWARILGVYLKHPRI